MDSWSPEIVLVTRRLLEDPEVVWRPGGRGGARRSWDHDWSPGAIWESYRDPGVCIWTLRSHGNPEVLRDVMTPMRPRLHRGDEVDLELIH
ncbi:hypothetical protein F2Q69_00005760 [Brassica cretica]|uniref:Uncharacterized protein n=1 Tax=Brassica cretica TaxID=69181 RepID=A0A8S9P4J7_BRACR|nr:hypothetical protein F2Q69_00005760 [Brassica cretica]